MAQAVADRRRVSGAPQHSVRDIDSTQVGDHEKFIGHWAGTPVRLMKAIRVSGLPAGFLLFLRPGCGLNVQHCVRVMTAQAPSSSPIILGISSRGPTCTKPSGGKSTFHPVFPSVPGPSHISCTSNSLQAPISARPHYLFEADGIGDTRISMVSVLLDNRVLSINTLAKEKQPLRPNVQETTFFTQLVPASHLAQF